MSLLQLSVVLASIMKVRAKTYMEFPMPIGKKNTKALPMQSN